MITFPGSARACNRAAILGVSPTMACSRKPGDGVWPITTKPLAIPMRTESRSPAGVFRRPTASMMSSAARTVRSASSSCALG